jgi:Do/DeqQ family serine protease
MSKNTGGGVLGRASLFVAGAAALALLLTGGLMVATLRGPAAVHAGGFEAVHTTLAVAPVPASTGYADLVAKVAPSIVTIRAERKVQAATLPFGEGELPPFFRRFGPGPEDRERHREGGLGSGVIVSADGYLLTNHHVVRDAEKVKVELSDRRSLDAKIVGVDPASDLAVLKIEAKGLPVLPFGDSDALRVGDVVLAFGNPLGIGQTVTMGIVSAKGRATGIGDGSFEDFLQTDAPINQGNSGGALVSATGQLVGINSQIVSPSGGNIGIGFAIPSRMAETVMTQLVNNGEVRRGQLGVTVQGITSDIAQSLGLTEVKGALVSAVTKDSPAGRAGLERGDVIVSVDGQTVTDGNALRNRIASLGPGSTVTIGLVRDGQEKTVRATLAQVASAKVKADHAEPGEGGRLGLAVRPVTPEMARELGLAAPTGLYVAEVEPDGPAADAGIRPGDVIEQVNRKPVTDVATLKAAVKGSAGKPALVLVTRKGDSLYLTIEPPRA